MQQIGLEAVLKDAGFQRGIAQMINAMNNAGATTQRTAQTSTQSFDRISVGAIAMGNIIANVVSSAVSKLASAIEAVPKYFVDSLATTAKWGESLDTLQDILGGTNEATTGLAVGMKIMSGDVEGGTAALSYFSRQTALTRDQFADAAETFRTASADAGEQIRQNLTDAAEQVAAVWDDVAAKREETEQGLADDIAKIQDDLNTKLTDIAEARAKNEADLTKSLSRLEDDTKDRLRNARTVKERRQVRKDAAQRKADLIEQYNEQQAALAKQEARERQTAEKQIALAEKVAQKQIDAAEKAAEKQVTAIEKALEKQNAAIEKSMAKSQKALADVQTKSPLSKALNALGLDFDKISDTSRPFEERLGDIMDAFAKLPKGVDRTAIALEIFGRAGVRWIDFLSMGRKGLKEMEKTGVDLGLVLDPNVLERYNQSLSRLDLSFTAIAVNIGKTLLPYAQSFIDRLNQVIVQVMPEFQNILGRLNTAFEQHGFQGLFDQMGIELRKITSDPKFQQAVNDAMQFASDALGAAITGAIKLATWIGDAAGSIITLIGNWASDPKNQPIINTAMTNIGNALGTALDAFIKTTVWVATTMIDLCASIIAWASTEEGKAWLGAAAGALAGGIMESFGNTVVAGIGGILAQADENAAQKEFEMTHPGETYVGSDVWKQRHTHAPNRDMGGGIYATGMYKLLKGEYVLNPQQAMAFAPVLAGATTRNTYQFGPNTWNGNPSAADRASIEKWAGDMVYRSIGRVSRKAR